MSVDGAIQSRSQFKDDPRSQARRWSLELQAAKDNQRKWLEQAGKVVAKFRDEAEDDGAQRLNLFHANVVTQRALLYGKVPKVDVGRRFQDQDDDDARVAGVIAERLLNTDIERTGDNYAAALKYALEDWTLVDLGCARVRYVCEWETVPATPAIYQPMIGGDGQPVMGDDGEPLPDVDENGEAIEQAPAVPEQQRKAWEDVETDWVYWKDFLWSPCRIWHERRWVAFRFEMTRDELVKRFGPIGKRVPLKEKKPEGDDQDVLKDAWSRAEGWEIWSIEDKKVYWHVEGYHTILDAKDDPLGLDGFFPCPRPLLSNASTTKLIPKPDYCFVQDIYSKIDVLYTRLCDLEDMLRVAGVYDQTCEGVERLLTEEARGKLIGVKGWLSLSEKGGIEGKISWFPLAEVAAAYDKTQAQLLAKMSLLFQVTGLSDIMRGQAAAPATATEQAIKAGFANTRSQTSQDELARFATDVQQLKIEIVAKHFDPQTIIERSNIEYTADGKDPGLVQRAVEVLKSRLSHYRIQVRPESISLPDLAQQKAEGVEYLTALAQFIPAMQPMAMAMPQAMPFLLELLKWGMSRFRGASTIEGVLDRAIAEAQKPRPPAPPDPKVLAEQERSKADVQKAQLGIAATKVQTQAKVIGAVADIAKTRAKMAMTPPPAPTLGMPAPPPGGLSLPPAQPFKPLVPMPPPAPMQGGM